jgi:branched-chain amino acid aminotransferase
MHYASSVFEGMMSYNGKIFSLKEHLQRLLKSAKTMYLHVNFSFEEIEQAISDLLERNSCNLGSHYIRPLIWPMDECEKIKRNANLFANVAIMVKEHIPVGLQKLTKLSISSWVKATENSIPHQCKGSGNYMNSILSKQEAAGLECDDAILLDSFGNVAEGASSNVFFVTKEGYLVTPRTQYCLAGITRKTIIEIALSFGILVEERNIAVEEIHDFAGAFLTGTAIEVQPVQSIYFPKQNKIAMFSELDLVKRLHIQYQKLCGIDEFEKM